MRRRAIVSILAACAASTLLGPQPARAQLPASFVANYARALDAMKTAYAQATVEGTVKQENLVARTSQDRSFTLRISGNWFRLDATTTAQVGTKAVVGGMDTVLATPDASLQGYQEPNTQRMSNKMKEYTYDDSRVAIDRLIPLAFPYSLGTQGTILDMLRSGGVTITSFKTGSRDGERMIQIKYDQQVSPDGQYGPWKCSLLLAPDQGYTLRDYEWTAGFGSQRVSVRGSLSYSVDSKGVPLLESFSRTDLRGSSPISKQSLSISKFDTEQPTLIEFRADGF
ncbi:MAG: hypothetical protein AB7O59_15520 [Pirellulales bacterium]